MAALEGRRPSLELVLGGRQKSVRKVAPKVDSAEGGKTVTSVKVSKETHRQWSVRAALLGMTMDEYIRHLFKHHKVSDDDVKRALQDRE